MPGDNEIGLQVRQFRGVNVALDPCFIDNRDLQRSENFAPLDLTGTVTTRRGTGPDVLLIGGAGDAIMRITAMIRTYDTADPPNRLMFSIATRSSGVDQLFVNVNDNSAHGPVLGGTDFTADQTYGMAVLGNKLYVSNGVDRFIKVVDLSTPFVAFDLAGLGVLADIGSVTTAAATGTALDAGTYSYAWAVLDTSTGFFLSRTAPQFITISANLQLQFTAPATALGANQVYQLFVTWVNLPIEFATGQAAEGLPASAPFTLATIDTGGPRVPLEGNVARTGHLLVAHRGRLLIGGDHQNRSTLYSTGPIEPGTEQEQFNLGVFFPALAQQHININDGDILTGLGVAALTTTQESPTAPLAIFKSTSTYLLQGDLDTGQYELIQLSRRIGCVSQRTIAHTPAGLIFCGLESVYLVPTALQEPLDIGWPIAPVIRAIPTPFRARCFAIYHNQFYKLFLVPQGQEDVLQEWWLDLHQGSVTDPPSWWGPMTHAQLAYSAAAVGQREPDSSDKAWAALATQLPLNTVVWNRTWNRSWGRGLSIGDALPIDDAESTVDANLFPISARMTTKRFDAGKPFVRKVFTGTRIIARANQTASIGVSVRYDTGPITTPPGLMIESQPVQWTRLWNRTWGESLYVEGDTRFLDSIDRRPHLTADITLTTPPNIRVDVRDFELRFLPVERPVA